MKTLIEVRNIEDSELELIFLVGWPVLAEKIVYNDLKIVDPNIPIIYKKEGSEWIRLEIERKVIAFTSDFKKKLSVPVDWNEVKTENGTLYCLPPIELFT